MSCGSLGDWTCHYFEILFFRPPLKRSSSIWQWKSIIFTKNKGNDASVFARRLRLFWSRLIIIIIFLDDPKSSVDDTFPRRYGTVRSTTRCLCCSLHPPMLPSSLPRRKEKSILVDNLAVPVDGTDDDDVGSRRRSSRTHPIPNRPRWPMAQKWKQLNGQEKSLPSCSLYSHRS